MTNIAGTFTIFDEATPTPTKSTKRSTAIQNAIAKHYLYNCGHVYKIRHDSREKTCIKCGHTKKDI